MNDFYFISNASMLLSGAQAVQPKNEESENLGGISKSTLKALLGQILALSLGCLICGVISLFCK